MYYISIKDLIVCTLAYENCRSHRFSFLLTMCCVFLTKNIIVHKLLTVNRKSTNIYPFLIRKMCTFDKILEVAKAKGITQVQLANHLGVGKQAVSEWKKGRSTAYMKRIGEIAEFLGVSVDYLVGNEEQNDNEKLSFALFGTADVDEEVLNDVRKYAQIARRMREEDKKKED